MPPRRSSGSGTRLRSAEALLAQLNERLDAPLTWELKRELVETLVEGIRVDTFGEGRRGELQVTVAYRFAPPDALPSHATPSSATATGTGTRASRKCGLIRIYRRVARAVGRLAKRRLGRTKALRPTHGPEEAINPWPARRARGGRPGLKP